MTGAATRLIALLGDPVEHSLSPAIQNAALAAAGIDAVYLAFRVDPENLPQAVEGLRAMRFLGANVTVPHKVEVIPRLDRLDPLAQILGAVNTIVNRDGELTGYNTDADGFLRSLGEVGFQPRERRAAVLGAGGAAAAVATRLALEGVSHLLLLNRTPSRARELAERIRQAVPGCAVDWRGLDQAGQPEVRDLLRSASLIANASRLGMGSGDPSPLPPDVFHPGQVVNDLVYAPLHTPFLQAAGAAGATVVTGDRMLLHQGALAFRLWAGEEAPLAPMEEALRQALAGQEFPETASKKCGSQ